MLPTTFLLVRHAQHDYPVDALAGRLANIHLSTEGKQQAGKLAQMLASLPVRAVYTSPLERTRETAYTIADYFGLPVQVSEALNEVDFGDWTGKAFEELSTSPAWRQWNALRSRARIPKGESMLEAQGRVVTWLEACRARHTGDPGSTGALSRCVARSVPAYAGEPCFRQRGATRRRLHPGALPEQQRFYGRNPFLIWFNVPTPVDPTLMHPHPVCAFLTAFIDSALHNRFRA
jgi:probable phosphoglycerate mutase